MHFEFNIITNDPMKDKLEDILVRTLYDNDQHTDPKISQAGFKIDNLSCLFIALETLDEQQFQNSFQACTFKNCTIS